MNDARNTAIGMYNRNEHVHNRERLSTINRIIMDPTIERERERDSFFIFFLFKQQEACFSLTVRTRNVSHETVKLSDETSVKIHNISL